jgi:hypothetical protein
MREPCANILPSYPHRVALHHRIGRGTIANVLKRH